MEPPCGIPPADSGGVGPKHNWEKACLSLTRIEGKGPTREGSPSIKLGLGIGAGSGGPSHVINQGKSAFTPAQLHQLHQQALIFKYIVSGLPVPFHLVLPIWKGVASAFGSAYGGIYDQYPSFIGFSPQGFDYRSMMDPEPGRCRRTDGKKWRCSRNVVPDQKYCDRHMHRGRQRSRKHVEASQNISASDTTTTINSSNTAKTINSNNTASTNTNLPISIPTNLQLTTPCSNTSNNVPVTAITTTTSSVRNNNGRNNNVDVNNASSATPTTINYYNSKKESNNNITVNRETTTATPFIGVAAGNSNSRNNSNYLGGKDAGFNRINDMNINRSSNNGNTGNFGSFVAPGLGFSPKSVLQVIGCSSSGFDYRTVIQTELQRCRRTDGKKWQCSRNVVPDQKYCEMHMHRGAKRLSVASDSVTVAAPPPSTSSTCTPPLAIIKRVDDRIDLNTNLSISISACPQQMTGDGNSSTSSSSSDATTITDENTSVSHMLALSP